MTTFAVADVVVDRSPLPKLPGTECGQLTTSS